MPQAASPQPPPVIARRLEHCRSLMKKHDIQCYLVVNRPDQVYLTGFDGEDGAVLITRRDVHLITDGRFEQTVQQQAPWARVVLRKVGLEDIIGTVCTKRKFRAVHFQPDHVSVQMHRSLRRQCQGTTLKPAPALVNDLRLSKDRAEVQRIAKAIDIAESAFLALREQLRPGMTETHIAAILEFEMKQRGASGPSFPTIVAEGANAALPHAHPGKRVLKNGSLLLIDWGAVSDHYCSDLTRVLFIGKIPPRFKRLYQIVLDAQQQAIAAIAPGKRACDIDHVARDHIAQAGYGELFGHGLGHGLGLDIHENPRLKFGFDDVLQPGMVVTVEPGIYLPGVGGIRIEDDVLVTDRGHEVLTHLPVALESAVVAA